MQKRNSKELPQEILFITDIEKMIGRNRLTLRRWWTDGKFPKPIKLHGTTLAWSKSTIERWIEDSIEIKN